MLLVLVRVTREPLAREVACSAFSFVIVSSASCFAPAALSSSPTACRHENIVAASRKSAGYLV